MPYKIDDRCLRRLFSINGFPLTDTEMGFFGLRGCLPLDVDDTGFAKSHELDLMTPDYVHPRCTLGQWLPAKKVIALFPGSTVPHVTYVRSAMAKGGSGANQLMTGLYTDYRKGIHNASTSTGHQAFRQTQGHPIRRTVDDFDFDSDDRVEFDNPYDNIHAAWSMSVSHDYYASAGCQVVVGYPQCAKRGKAPDAGPWKVFKENAYEIRQDSFPYVLLEAREVQAIAIAGAAKRTARLRFGSQGALVASLQKKLKAKGYYEGREDGDFGDRTNRAVLKFQTAQFGPSADDGIVGPVTASALDFALPKL